MFINILCLFYFSATMIYLCVVPLIEPSADRIFCAFSSLSKHLSTEKLRNSHSIIFANHTKAPISKNSIAGNASSAYKIEKPTERNSRCWSARLSPWNGFGRSGEQQFDKITLIILADLLGYKNAVRL